MPNLKKFIYTHAVPLSACWALVILALCAIPGRYIPETGWMALLSVDKLAHAALFFVQGILVILSALIRYLPRSVLKASFFLGICYGILLEVMQGAVFSERSMEWQDMVANTAGLLVAALFHKRLAKAERAYLGL